MSYYFESDTPSYSDPKKLEDDYQNGVIFDFELQSIIESSKSLKIRNKAGRLLLDSTDSTSEEFRFLIREFEAGQRIYSEAWKKNLEWGAADDLATVCYALVQTPTVAKGYWGSWYREMRDELKSGEVRFLDSEEESRLCLIIEAGLAQYKRQAAEILLLRGYFSGHYLESTIREEFPDLVEKTTKILASLEKS